MLKAKVKNDEFLKGLSQTSDIAGKFTSMPILTNVLLETSGGKLILNATDLEITFQASYDAEVLGEGKITIPAKHLYQIANSVNAEIVELEEKEHLVLNVKADNFKADIFGLSAEDFPRPASVSGVPMTEFESDALIDAINKTSYTVNPASSGKFNLAGIQWIKETTDAGISHIRLVSSDVNRLNYATLNPQDIGDFLRDNQLGILISQKGILELKSLAETVDKLKIGVNISHLTAQTDNAILSVRLLEGNFPDYKSVVPQNPVVTVTFSRKDLHEVVTRMNLLTTPKYRAIFFNFSEDKLLLSTKNPDLGEAEEEFPMDYKFPPMSVAFDPRHILDSLKVMKSDRVKLSILDLSKPVAIYGDEDPGFLGIIATITQKE
jgi:DNA polymerase-3 subunit beta